MRSIGIGTDGADGIEAQRARGGGRGLQILDVVQHAGRRPLATAQSRARRSVEGAGGDRSIGSPQSNSTAVWHRARRAVPKPLAELPFHDHAGSLRSESCAAMMSLASVRNLDDLGL